MPTFDFVRIAEKILFIAFIITVGIMISNIISSLENYLFNWVRQGLDLSIPIPPIVCSLGLGTALNIVITAYISAFNFFLAVMSVLGSIAWAFGSTKLMTYIMKP